MRRVALVAGVLLWPSSTSAHLVTTGLGPVYDGVSHLFVTFDDLLPVVAMAILAGLQGPVAGRRTLFALPFAWLVAGLAGHASGTSILPLGGTALSLLVLGTLGAADRRLDLRVVTALAAVLGIVHGWENGASLALDGRSASGLVGIGGSIFVVSALVGAWVSSLRPPWTRIAVRAAASWVAAIGLLYLGWTLRARV